MTHLHEPVPLRRPGVLAALVLAALVVGIVLRVWLALVNTEANDPHLPVIGIIAFEHRIPERTEAWEAFQPMLYHSTVALVWRAMPTRDPFALTRAAQLVSCAAGVLTVFVLLRFLHERYAGSGGIASAPGPALAFSLTALNPALMGISAQATNDAFLVLFCSLALHFGVRFMERWRTSDFLAMAAATVAAGLSKGNALVLVIAVILALAIVAFVPPREFPRTLRRGALRHGTLFVVVVVPAIAFIGPYASAAREVGSPFATNWHRSPLPSLFHETLTERPGLTSLAHGLATFRFFNLLRHPASTWESSVYPRHRTSLWSRMYAHAHSMRFERWPPSWGSRSRAALTLTRLLFVLGTIPLALLAWGCFDAVRSALRERRGVRRGTETPTGRWAGDVLLLLAAAGSLAFAALYAVRYRDYSAMKVIFVFPGLLAFSAVLAVATDGWAEWCAARAGPWRRAIARAVTAGLAALLIGYVAEAGMLIRDLQKHRPSARPPSLDPRTGLSTTPPAPWTEGGFACTPGA